MSEKLEPCPFCGGEASVFQIDGPYWEGGCGDENCIGFNAILADTQAEAITKWNRRVPPPPDRGMAGALAKELKRLIQYGRWQVSEESPGWHPTFPSAVGAAAETLARYEAFTAAQPQPERAIVFAQQRCPRCGSPLLSDGKRVWCSFVGGESNTSAAQPACTYGIDTAIVAASQPERLSMVGAWQSMDNAPVDSGQNVLVATQNGWVGEAYCEPERGDWWEAGTHWTDAHDGEVRDIIAWQPLPAPPATPPSQ